MNKCALYLIQFHLISFTIIFTYDLRASGRMRGSRQKGFPSLPGVHKINVFCNLTFFLDSSGDALSKKKVILFLGIYSEDYRQSAYYFCLLKIQTWNLNEMLLRVSFPMNYFPHWWTLSRRKGRKNWNYWSSMELKAEKNGSWVDK